jgi:hypothetical protein
VGAVVPGFGTIVSVEPAKQFPMLTVRWEGGTLIAERLRDLALLERQVA